MRACGKGLEAFPECPDTTSGGGPSGTADDRGCALCYLRSRGGDDGGVAAGGDARGAALRATSAEGQRADGRGLAPPEARRTGTGERVMPNDPFYDAVLSRAGVHLQRAWDAFCEDPAVPWRDKSGNVPRERTRVWVDALKEALAHHEQLERLR